MRTTFDYIIAVSQPGALRVEGKLSSLRALAMMKMELADTPARSHVESAVLLVMSDNSNGA